MKRAVIIVAGGSGLRMGKNKPKQFINIGSRPILMHTIERFYRYDKLMQLIVVLPSNQINFWEQMCDDYQFKINIDLIEGGETRFHSVKNGLSLIKGDSLIGIHDGVRPLVSYNTLERCYEGAEEHGTAIPVMDSIESVRLVKEDKSHAIPRSQIKLVQTPQVFHSNILIPAYNQLYQPEFTDDASVVEAMGHSVHLVDGNSENIKITNPVDIEIAELLLSKMTE